MVNISEPTQSVASWESEALARLRDAADADAALAFRLLLRHFALLERLTIEVASAGYFISYGQKEGDGLLGAFSVHNGTPSILMFRPQGAALATEPFQTLLTLAHEYGHAQAWRSGYRTRAYLNVVDAANERQPLPPESAFLVLDEECRAWIHARSSLSALGLDAEEIAAFQKRKVDSLESYCERLGLPSGCWQERERTCNDEPRDDLPSPWCEACLGDRWKERQGADR
jgi:hypothetical protein